MKVKVKKKIVVDEVPGSESDHMHTRETGRTLEKQLNEQEQTEQYCRYTWDTGHPVKGSHLYSAFRVGCTDW